MQITCSELERTLAVTGFTLIRQATFARGWAHIRD